MRNIPALCIAAALCLMSGCGQRKNRAEVPKTIQQIQQEKGVPVGVSKIGYGIIRRIERSNGTLQGCAEASLANGIGGTVKDITVAIGETVKKDAVVAVMDIDGGSPVDVAQSAYEYAQKSYERAKKLQEQGAISREQVEGARVKYEDAKRNLGQAEVGVNVMAPFTGTVLEIYESRGSKVSSQTRLVKIADLSAMEIQMQVNEQAVSFYKKGQKAFLLMENDTIWGTIHRIALGANGMAHSFEVTARFPNPDRRLKPGMFKQVQTVVEEKPDARYVPLESVNFDQRNAAYVYLVKQGIAVRTPIVIGIHNGDNYEVLDGLTTDDTVAVSGLTMLSNGVKVNIVNQ